MLGEPGSLTVVKSRMEAAASKLRNRRERLKREPATVLDTGL